MFLRPLPTHVVRFFIFCFLANFSSGQADTMKIIDECNGHWKALVDGKTEAGKMWIK